MNSSSKLSKWLLPRNRRSRPARRKSRQRRLALERLDPREMLSVTAMVTDSNVLFQTDGQNMWESGPAATISAGFSETLLDVKLPSLSLGGYAKLWNPIGPDFKTGLEVKASGGFKLGFSGNFEVSGGEVDVDYQTDITVSALAADGSALTSVAAGEHFLMRASESPDPNAIAMETKFAHIGAGLFLDYGLDINASLKGKILDKTIISFC